MSLSSSGKTWVLSQEAFDKLLLAFDPDREQAGYKYEMLRQKLLKFFEWRGATAPEDHADEVLNRLARKIEHGEALRDLSSYSVGVARMMLLEISRDKGASMVHEREALEFLRDILPDRDPNFLYSNFEFIADDGSVNEIDALVVTQAGVFLIELKSRGGIVTTFS